MWIELGNEWNGVEWLYIGSRMSGKSSSGSERSGAQWSWAERSEVKWSGVEC